MVVSKKKQQQHLSTTTTSGRHLLVAASSSMKDLASCFGEHAVRVSDVSCSGSSGGSVSVSVSASSPLLGAPPVPDSRAAPSAVTALYRARLVSSPAPRELLIRVSWSRSHVGPALSVGVDDSPSPSSSPMTCHLLRKKKGSRSFTTSRAASVSLSWDVSSAKYASGPEPVANFYLSVSVDGEPALSLGDGAPAAGAAEFSLLSRKEQVLLAQAFYSTRAQFRQGGREHEITIRCGGDDAAELAVCVDRKRVVHVRRLRWNFRGNQTIFVDGSPVDMMWDVHDWWFSSPAGYAVFMFRTRTALETRLWLEEEMVADDHRAPAAFSLLIQAFKNPT
ncbi:hypothetical protein ACMD2_15711 [Ananas comosus]|uniref:DUF868 domain-containing protein n=1 Tax=Ananas comosus TaxID=4615 RepID=A0A199UII7_ANACO|nr:hypothetical protein ACMD2_15711 [Ananas comosus]